MRPLLFWEVLPLDLGHGSTAEYQSAELVHRPILRAWIVVVKILLEPFEELALPTFLAFQAKPHERCNRLADTGIDGLRVFFYLAGDGRRQADRVSCCRLAPSIELAFPAADSRVLFRRLGLRHISSVCIKVHRFATGAEAHAARRSGTAKLRGSLSRFPVPIRQGAPKGLAFGVRW